MTATSWKNRPMAKSTHRGREPRRVAARVGARLDSLAIRLAALLLRGVALLGALLHTNLLRGAPAVVPLGRR